MKRLSSFAAHGLRRIRGSSVATSFFPSTFICFAPQNTFPPQSLKNWISFWKNHVTRAWLNRDEVPIWQTEYWDRQLRCGESYGEKWDYVENNPVRHGYVRDPEDWPYRGEINVLDWHD